MKRTYGWKPDVPDHRDNEFVLPRAVHLPSHVDRIGLGNPIEDQGALGSCTGNATTSAMEIVTSVSARSRLMAYYNGRALEGTTRQDAGCMIRDVVKGVRRWGVGAEALWPYNIARFRLKPPAKAYIDGDATRSLIGGYQRVFGIDGVRTVLAQGMPVIFGFSVPDFFESNEVARTGWVRLPKDDDVMLGGHAVLAVGYDERAETGATEPFVWVRNSWGSAWGKDGYFAMPYSWFTDRRRLVDDLWVLVPAA